MMGVKIDGPKYMYGDNQSVIHNNNRGHIDKPISAYTSYCVQTSYVKYHFYTQFNHGVFVEWLWGIPGHIYLDDEKTSSQRDENGLFLNHFAAP